jgi:hypothetical protein
MLIGGVPGVAPAKVVVIGGGVVGSHAITMAIGLGADVTVLDRNTAVLGNLAETFGPALTTIYSTKAAVEESCAGSRSRGRRGAGARRRHAQAGHPGPRRRMKPGSVLVDVAIDQGGCFETSKPTTHSDPTFIVDEVVHYCVANMPGAVPKTSTFALNNATLPFTLALADKGAKKALLDDPNFLPGLNVIGGQVTCEGGREALGYDYVDPKVALRRGGRADDAAADGTDGRTGKGCTRTTARCCADHRAGCRTEATADQSPVTLAVRLTGREKQGGSGNENDFLHPITLQENAAHAVTSVKCSIAPERAPAQCRQACYGQATR